MIQSCTGLRSKPFYQQHKNNITVWKSGKKVLLTLQFMLVTKFDALQSDKRYVWQVGSLRDNSGKSFTAGCWLLFKQPFDPAAIKASWTGRL